MKRQISVDEAITRLQLLLANFFVSMLFVFGIALYILVLQLFPIYIFLLIFFLASPVISVLSTAFWLFRWKYWAFENVRNVHELKRRAILTNLVSENDEFFVRINNCVLST